MNNLDATIQRMFPTVMAPQYEELAPLSTPGHRYINGRDGVYVEVHRPWIHGIFRLSQPFAMPYGPVTECCNIKLLSTDLRGIIQSFMERATEEAPLESARWYCMSAETGGIEAWDAPPHHRSAGHISYERPPASATSVPFLDCHSHGAITPAFWSRTDNKDDFDDLKLALVVGGLHTDTPSLKARLVGTPLPRPVELSDWVASVLYD